MIHKFLHVRHAGICAVLLIPLLTPNIVRAEIIDAYLGMNFVASYGNVPEVQLQKITYIGANGKSTVDIPELAGNSPYHGTPLTGLPDGLGLSAVPTYITGGDGETTRSFGKVLAINWDTSGTTPTIQVTDIEVNVPGLGIWTAGFDTPYTVGLIPNTEADTELDSAFDTPQGDVYSDLVSSPGNAVGTVIATGTPIGLESLIGTAFGEFIFSAGLASDPVEMVGDLAVAVIELNIKQGIATSLDAKAKRIIEAMEEVKRRNHIAVHGKLKSFKEEVKAQSGKTINEKEAALLVEMAELIRWSGPWGWDCYGRSPGYGYCKKLD